MHALLRSAAIVCVTLTGFAPTFTLTAQAQVDDGPPKVLLIQREYLKPGKGGSMHDRSEAAFVKAFEEAKYPTHYFAMDSMSGPSRSLFLVSYDSFAAWEKDNAAMRANKTLAAAVDHAIASDGDLLSSYDAGVFMLRPDLSLNKGSIKGTHYFEISTYVVKPGHMHEFEELAKMYIEGFRKVAPDTHWDTFETMYGMPVQGVPSGGVFLVINTMKSLDEVDKGNADFMKFSASLGASGMRKLEELTAASVQTMGSNMFEINPRMSYPPKEWLDWDSGFWKVSHPMAAKKPAAAKPAAQ